MIRLREGKLRASGSVPGGRLLLGNQQALERHLLLQFAMLGGIDDIDAARDDADGTAGQGTAMGRSVDAARQAGNDHQPSLGDAVFGEVSRQLDRSGGRIARPDHSHEGRPARAGSPRTMRMAGAPSVSASKGG